MLEESTTLSLVKRLASVAFIQIRLASVQPHAARLSHGQAAPPVQQANGMPYRSSWSCRHLFRGHRLFILILRSDRDASLMLLASHSIFTVPHKRQAVKVTRQECPVFGPEFIWSASSVTSRSLHRWRKFWCERGSCES